MRCGCVILVIVALTGLHCHQKHPMKTMRDWLPSSEAIRANRWLRWLGPALHDPRLWHMSRRGLALGMALGFFFGLLIPLAQIPLSAAAAVALRANVPAAVASTLVTNPFTFGPLYYAAWRVGSAVLGAPGDAPPSPGVAAPIEPADEGWWSATTRSGHHGHRGRVHDLLCGLGGLEGGRAVEASSPSPPLT
jgi:hypothetical protein